MIPERVKVAAAILVHGLPKAPPMPKGVQVWTEGVEAINLLADDFEAAQLRSAAMSMLDEEVIGYVLMTVRREFTGPGSEVRVLASVARELVPAVNETMRRFIAAARTRA